jgi:hypothetical protein
MKALKVLVRPKKHFIILAGLTFMAIVINSCKLGPNYTRSTEIDTGYDTYESYLDRFKEQQ